MAAAADDAVSGLSGAAASRQDADVLGAGVEPREVELLLGQAALAPPRHARGHHAAKLAALGGGNLGVRLQATVGEPDAVDGLVVDVLGKHDVGLLPHHGRVHGRVGAVRKAVGHQQGRRGVAVYIDQLRALLVVEAVVPAVGRRRHLEVVGPQEALRRHVGRRDADVEVAGRADVDHHGALVEDLRDLRAHVCVGPGRRVGR